MSVSRDDWLVLYATVCCAIGLGVQYHRGELFGFQQHPAKPAVTITEGARK